MIPIHKALSKIYFSLALLACPTLGLWLGNQKLHFSIKQLFLSKQQSSRVDEWENYWKFCWMQKTNVYKNKKQKQESDHLYRLQLYARKVLSLCFSYSSLCHATLFFMLFSSFCYATSLSSLIFLPYHIMPFCFLFKSPCRPLLCSFAMPWMCWFH